MAINPQSKTSIQAAVALVGIFALICIAYLVFGTGTSLLISNPTATAVLQTSSPSDRYQPELIPPLTYTPNLTQIATSTPTHTLVPTRTLIVIPTLVSINDKLLPDLTVTSVSDPVCTSEYDSTILKFTIFVRNIGRASTRNFGPFDVGVYLILGQRRYGLDEWAEKFNGVIATSRMEVANLNPNADIKFSVVIDLKGNKNFGIEVMTETVTTSYSFHYLLMGPQ